MKRKVSIKTLGCRYNRLESAEMAYEMERAGYVPAQSGETADVVVINTCTVTSKSDARCRAAIRRARASHPEALVVVAGCYSETRPDEAARVEGADIVLGNQSKFDIAKALNEAGAGGYNKNESLKPVNGQMRVRPITRMQGRTNAYVNIQTGCDEVCSFCIVRIARGKSRSADPADIVEQVKRLSTAGIKEVALSGINLGEYGKDFEITLPDLIEKLLDETKIPRIRLSSINPNNVTGRLMDVMAGSSRVCRHLHIPLQSGSNKVLKRMRRPYSAEIYEELMGNLAERIPGIGLGADVMVGFPGETREEFAETYELIERSPIMMCHVFAYSQREGTEAFAMNNSVPKSEKKRRSALLKKLSAKKGLSNRERFIGKRLNVLVENKRDREGFLKGFSDNYLQVKLQGPDSLKNEIIPVEILLAGVNGLSGSPV